MQSGLDPGWNTIYRCIWGAGQHILLLEMAQRVALLGLASVLAVVLQLTTAGPLPNNGCPKKWIYYNFRCYHFVSDPKLDWPSADAFCKNDTGGAYLVSVETMDELNFLEKYTIQRTKQLGDIERQQWWTGGYLDMDYYSSWVWGVPDALDGYPPGVVPFGLLREAWYPGEPNDENDEEKHISIRFDKVGLGLDDKSSEVEMGFICEKDPLVRI